MSDYLLEVLATRGTIRVDEFYRSLDSLFSVTDEAEDASLNRRLVLGCYEDLSHCEVDRLHGNVHCCPGALVMLPDPGSAKAILVGARTSALLSRLVYLSRRSNGGFFVEVTTQKYRGYPLPKAVFIEAAERSVLHQLGETLGMLTPIDFPYAWYLVNASGSLEEYQQQLAFHEDASLSWPSRVFDPDGVMFSGRRGGSASQLVEYMDPRTTQRMYRWVVGDDWALVDRDWGRYLALKESSRNVLMYDPERQLLAAPVTAPLPTLLSRAAVLCSGLIPAESHYPVSHSLDATALVYSKVPTAIAVEIAARLSQKLIRTGAFCND